MTMKLRYSPSSPYVRKVTVTAIETGLDDRIERIATNPWDPASDLPDDNPLGKVPALVTENGETLYDSAVICEYLDSLHDGAKLFPADGVARWKALKLHALGDGILEAAVLCFVENARRPEELRWSGWLDRQKEKIGRALDWLEGEAGSLTGPLTIGHITVASALAYLDFRMPEDDWRPGRERLAEWFGQMNARPSMQATIPANPT